MTALHIERLKKMAEFLRELRPAKFRITQMVTGYGLDESNNICGTICCALGWMPKVFPEDAFWKQRGMYDRPRVRLTETPRTSLDHLQIGSRFFGLDMLETNRLFNSRDQAMETGGILSKDCTPNDVAAEIEKFLKEKEAVAV